MARVLDATIRTRRWKNDWLGTVWLRNVVFQIHLWVGAAVSMYVMLSSLSGSVIVYRNELSTVPAVEWLVRLHDNLLAFYRHVYLLPSNHVPQAVLYATGSECVRVAERP